MHNQTDHEPAEFACGRIEPLNHPPCTMRIIDEDGAGQCLHTATLVILLMGDDLRHSHVCLCHVPYSITGALMEGIEVNADGVAIVANECTVDVCYQFIVKE